MTFSFRRMLFSSLAIWFVVSLFGIYFLLHLGRFLNFGIDLVGGTYIRLDVQVEKAVDADLAERARLLVDAFKAKNNTAPTIRVENSQAIITCQSEAIAREVELFMAQKVADNARLRGTLLTRDAAVVRLSLASAEVSLIEQEAVRGNVAVLEARLNPTGSSEVSIVPHGDKSIIVELPNVHNTQQAKMLIGKTALLEIKLVEDAGRSEEELIEKYGGMIPDGLMIVPGKGDEGRRQFYLVPAYTDLTGRLLRDASMAIEGRMGAEPVVKFVFSPEGGEKFYQLTSQNIGRQVAVIIDNEVITAPVVQAAISTEGIIHGSYTVESAQTQASLLKSGAFVAPVTFEEERTIEASLGASSVRQGLAACIIGLALLFLFGVATYKVSGLFAFIVLIYNLLLILFALAMVGATLTLPGIAGMILTVGMAIDASILIYERIKEEVAQGVPFKKALNAGFSGALAVILDANITHLLVSIVLYRLGAGPLKGFAVTMIIGIVATLITGLLLLRSIFNFVIDVLGIQKVSM